MRQSVLLVSHDSALAARVERALPPSAVLHQNADLASLGAEGPQPWLLALIDGRAAGAAAFHPGRDIPVLWLGELPLLAAGLPPADCLPGPVVDFLDRNLPASALTFILQQHVTAAYLRALRASSRPALAVVPFHADLNNALTGLLGNAHLAAAPGAGGRRLPPPLVERLHCIEELAERVQRLLAPGMVDNGG